MQETPTAQQPPIYQPTPPMYPPPTYQPPHSRKRLWLILGIIAAVLVIGIIGASMAASGGQHTTTPQVTKVVQQTSTQPFHPPAAQVAQSNTIGKPVQVGDTWVVTVNSVKTSAGSEYIYPESGYTYLVVDVTLKNTSSSVQSMSSFYLFSLKDQTGQQYPETGNYSGKAAPNGNVGPGSLLRGEMVYEVPSSMHNFTLSFTSSYPPTNDMAEWKLTV